MCPDTLGRIPCYSSHSGSRCNSQRGKEIKYLDLAHSYHFVPIAIESTMGSFNPKPGSFFQKLTRRLGMLLVIPKPLFTTIRYIADQQGRHFINYLKCLV